MPDVQAFTITATHGVVDGLDVTLGVVWQNLIEHGDGEFADGVGNVAANTKWRFFQNGDGSVLFTFNTGYSLPFGSARDGDLAVLEADLRVLTIAERFVVRRTAAAQRDPVADLVGFAV